MFRRVKLLLIALSLLSVTNLEARDFGQCERRCAQQYGEGAVAKKVDRLACECFRDKKRLGKIDRLYPLEVASFGQEVCGLDGKDYPSAEAAQVAGSIALHAGQCGKCSNTHDIGIYRSMAKTLSTQSRKCGMVYLFLGRKMGERCMNRRIGFTPGCNECWIENIGCTVTHCKAICAKSIFKRKANAVGDQLSDCFACDEIHCGGPFIRCAGANRRRAGVATDLPRSQTDFWVAPETQAPPAHQ